jgi:small subunit ribosomal protein S2
MRKQPDAVFIIDLKKEQLAVREARRLNLPVIALVDTNCDPDEADYVIPGNDDAIRSCTLIARVIAEAINEGKQKVSAREFSAAQQQQQQNDAQEQAAAEAASAAASEAASEAGPDAAAEPVVAEGKTEKVEAGAAVEPATEGESVPVPTGDAPQTEGAAKTDASAAPTEEVQQ